MDDDRKRAGHRDVEDGDRGVGYGEPTPASVSAPELKTLVAWIVAPVTIAGLFLGRDVLIPITLAGIMSFVLSPIVNQLQRKGLGRAPAVVITVVVALSIIGAIGTVIGTQAASLAEQAPRYAQTITAKVEGVRHFAAGRVIAFSRMFGGESPSAAAADDAEEQPDGVKPAPVPVKVVTRHDSPLGVMRSIVQPVLSPLEATIIVLVVSIFMLAQKEDLRDRFIRLFGSSDLHRTTLAIDDAGKRLSRYFLSQLAVNTGFGVIIGTGVWLIGIPSPVMWGVLAGLLRFVPYVGAPLAAVAPIVLGAAITPAWTLAIYVVVLFLVVEPITAYVVEPLVYGHSTGLSPVSVVVSAIFWTWLWGPIGLILSTPLTLCLVVLGRHVKSLEFFDVMLGDRPALSPVDAFYQRVLANNPDEALSQAETLLKDRSLAEYYEEIVVPGLKLVAEDRARGALDRERAQRMTESLMTVIGDLADYVESGTEMAGSAWECGRVACMGGRGAFDMAVAAMAAQLIETHGIGASTIRREAASRDAIQRLDLTGFSVIVLCFLDLAGAPAHLRYLVRRLKLRSPDARLVVGLWQPDDEANEGEDMVQMIGADRYARSLRELVDAVIALSPPRSHAEAGDPTA